MPTIKEAEKFIIEAEIRNPGLWIAHSRFVAKAARNIAEYLLYFITWSY